MQPNTWWVFSFLNTDFERLPGDSNVEYWYLNVLDFGITLLYLRKASLLPMEQLLRTPYISSSARKIPWRMDRLTTPVFLAFPGDSAGKESACNVRDLSSIPGLGRPPGEGKGYPLQYSGLENSMDCIVHRVAKNWTQLSDFHIYLMGTP